MKTINFLQKQKRWVMGICILVLIGAILVLFQGKALKTHTGESSVSVSERAREANKKCQNQANWAICYTKEMEDTAYLKGSAYAHKVLYAIQDIDPQVRGGCHFVAHGIGWGVYKKDPSKALSSIAESGSACSWGEQMGIVEKYIANIPGGKLRGEDIQRMCEPNPGTECNHALGHMLLVETRDDVDEALEMCNFLKDDTQKAVCSSGVFMERVIGSNLYEHGISEGYRDWRGRMRDHEALCRSYAENPLLETSCWRILSIPAQYYFDEDPEKIFDFCNTASSREASWSCKMHLIAEIGPTLKIGNDLDKMKEFCLLDQVNEPDFEEECYKYLVIIKINSSPLGKARDAVPFCSRLMRENQQSECFWGIGHGLYESGATEKEKQSFCVNSPQKYKSLCGGDLLEQQDNTVLHDLRMPGTL
jgi:hypothetical protein